MPPARKRRNGRKGGALALLSAAFLMAPECSRGAGPPATVTALDKARSVQSVALGGAGVAMPYEPGMLWLNPASPAGWRVFSLSVSATRGRFDEVTSNALCTLGLESSVVSVGLAYYDAGMVAANTPDGSIVRFDSQRDVLGAFGIAGCVGPAVSLGCSFKLLHSELAGSFPAQSLAGDVGLQIRLGDWIRCGGVVRNVGTRYSYRSEQADTATTAVGGVALMWTPGLFAGDEGSLGDLLVLLGDVSYEVKPGISSVHAGAEYRVGDLLALRGGYRRGTAGSLGGASAGLRVTLRRSDAVRTVWYQIEYAVELAAGPFDRPHSLSLSYSW